MDQNQRLCIYSNQNGDWVVEDPATMDTTRTSVLPKINDDRWIPIEGIYGFYKIPSGILLVLIGRTESVFDAPAFGNWTDWWQIYRVKHLELVHLSNRDARLTPNHVKEEVRQLRLLRKSLKQHDFYCCNKTSPLMPDMTKTLQTSFLSYNNNKINQTISNQGLSTNKPDPRFFWNQAAVDPILSRATAAAEEEDGDVCAQVLLNHTIPVTSAFVGFQSNITCNNNNSSNSENTTGTKLQYTELLISRRSRFRAGTRFTRRGADASGAVANYAETEQVTLVSTNKNKNGGVVDKLSSHVQIRGSIPIRWSSPADVKTYRPRVHIGTDPLAQARALRWHLLEQQSYYVNKSKNNTDIVFVNLVDKKSDQGRLGRAFDEVLQAVIEVHGRNDRIKVQHVWYDFHAQVKNGRWDRLSKLLKDLKPHLVKHGYFSVRPNELATTTSTTTPQQKFHIESKQLSMIRTNCMDCLDRTNVVQSILGRWVLFQQLSQGINDSSNKERFRKSKQLSLPWEHAEACHRALWADNADEISRLYAGTPALKRDFTRTGKRTRMGALDDGKNSLQRYYLNNFMDADRQEGMDLMVGHATFSNIGATSKASSSASTEGDEDDAYGTYEARRALLGNLFGISTGNDQGEEEDVEDDDDEDVLDLRWVPGDLQEHLRSQAADTMPSPQVPSRFGFSASKALKAMDERSTSDLPWWSITTPSSTASVGTSTDGSSSSGGVEDLEPHQQHASITRSQVVGMLLLGMQAPRTVSMVMVILLGVLYLNDILQHDVQTLLAAARSMQQQQQQRGGITQEENKLDDDTTSSTDSDDDE
eukprot:scaffold3515_cov126-Cylindrotheca_fusiformis.AAC.13